MNQVNKICAIVLNFNSSADTVALYEQLSSYKYPDLHILVVDNNSISTEQDALIADIPEKNLVQNDENLGYAGGNNIGIKLAIEKGYTHVLLLNPDIRLTDRTIPVMVNTLQGLENAAAIGPRICYRNNPELIYSDGGKIDPAKGYLSSHINYNVSCKEINSKDSVKEVDYVNGSCILIKTDVLKEIGSFKEFFFLYFEETEWCLRAKRSGYKNYVTSEVSAFHHSSDKGKVYYYYMVRNRLILAKLNKEYYSLTRNKIFKTLVKDLLNAVTKGKKTAHWIAKFKGFLAGTLYTIKS